MTKQEIEKNAQMSSGRRSGCEQMVELLRPPSLLMAGKDSKTSQTQGQPE